MKKGLITFPAELLIRIAAGFLFAALIVSIGCKVFTIDTGSNAARESFDELVSKLEKSKAGDIIPHELVLDKNEKTAILAFTRTSEKIEFVRSSDFVSWILFTRPKECTSGKACLCYCSQFSPTLPAKALPDVSNGACEVALQCTSFGSFDFPNPLKKENYLPKNIIFGANNDLDYSFKGGFILTQYGSVGAINGAGPIILTIERKGDIVGLCDHQDCLKSK
jgi:hypothetical protein